MQTKHTFKNRAGLLYSKNTFSDKVSDIKLFIQNAIKVHIEKKEPFNLIVDECDDKTKPGATIHTTTYSFNHNFSSNHKYNHLMFT